MSGKKSSAGRTQAIPPGAELVRGGVRCGGCGARVTIVPCQRCKSENEKLRQKLAARLGEPVL